MREITVKEMDSVVGAGLIGDFINGLSDSAGRTIGRIGLIISIPTIVIGAITGIPTLGLGFVAMTVGIIGTAISGSILASSKDKPEK